MNRERPLSKNPIMGRHSAGPYLAASVDKSNRSRVPDCCSLPWEPSCRCGCQMYAGSRFACLPAVHRPSAAEYGMLAQCGGGYLLPGWVRLRSTQSACNYFSGPGRITS